MDSFDRMTGGNDAVDGGAQGARPDSAGGKRVTARDTLLLVAQCRLGDEAQMHEVCVRNLSEGGLMIELDRSADVGSAVWLDLPGIGAITGKVAWCAAGRLGIALDMPIEPARAHQPG